MRDKEINNETGECSKEIQGKRDTLTEIEGKQRERKRELLIIDLISETSEYLPAWRRFALCSVFNKFLPPFVSGIKIPMRNNQWMKECIRACVCMCMCVCATLGACV